MKHWWLLIFFCGAISLAAAEGERDWHPYDQFFDRPVVVQGLGWGRFSKGLGIRVVMPSGVPVYLDVMEIEDARKFEPFQGKLIEVRGILKLKEMKAAPEGAQGFGQRFQYLGLSDYTIKPIDRVEHEMRAVESRSK